MQATYALSPVPGTVTVPPAPRPMRCPVRQQLLPSLAVLLASLLLWALVYTAPATAARRTDALTAVQPGSVDVLSVATGPVR